MDQDWRTHDIALGAPADESVLRREWLLTNGAGGYAMGTVGGWPSRRYHGLLVAAAQPPVGRVVALNQVFEQIVQGGQVREFSACAFIGADGREVHAPRGHELLRRFERGLSVRWSYEAGALRFRRELRVHWKNQAATLSYEVEGLDHPAVLRLAPMLTLRDFHSVAGRDDAAFEVRAQGDVLRVRRGSTGVTLRLPGARTAAVEGEERWWQGVYYEQERQRGQEDHEAYFVPARFEVDLPAGVKTAVALTVALGDQPAEPAADDRPRATHLAPVLRRLEGEANRPRPLPHLPQAPRLLTIAADDFVVDRVLGREKLSTILAGYPWFADWGRDTFIALPGLLLATGRFEEARTTLRAFAQAIRGGLVPNRFDDYDQQAAHYNTADASLWFVHAALAYQQASGDDATWRDWLAEAASEVLRSYLKGTEFDIRAAGDGLISAGGPGTQLTWMDAATDGVVFTPRWGKAVEINALWYSALCGMSEGLAPLDRSTADHYRRLSGRVKRAFASVFWDEERGCLLDHVREEDGQWVGDRTLRPNQIFAVSLPHSPLPRTKQVRVLQAVRDHLLTPMGLRTLPEDDPNYHPRYRGGRFERDRAYHQGTVWPWLIGPYAEAVLRAGQFTPEAAHEALQALNPLLTFMAGEGLGQLHEIHDAAEPHTPGGCPAQAWSVAEVLRVLRMIEETLEGS